MLLIRWLRQFFQAASTSLRALLGEPRCGRPNTVGSPWWVPVAATAVLAAAIGRGAICGEPPIRRLTPVESSASETGQPLADVRPAAAQFPAAETITNNAETLEEAWAIALQVADRLAAARLSAAEAESLRCAASSQRWPDLGLSSFYRVRQDELALVFDRSSLGLPPFDYPIAQSEAFGFRSAVTLPLYTSGRISHQIEAADCWVQAARSTVETEHSQLRLLVAEEYIAILRAQSEVDLAHSNVRSLAAHANDVEKRFDHGLAARNDLLAAQVSLANARHAAIRAENHLDVSRAAYNRRMARPLTSPVTLAELPLPGSAGELETLTATATHQRRELRRLAAEASAMRKEAAALLAQSGLQVGVVGAYDFEENRYQAPQGLASAAVGATWNAFDAGQTRHRADAVQQRANALLRLRADLESAIGVEVHSSWLNVHETTRRIQVAEEAVGRAEENLRVARRLYATGSGTAREVLDAESLRTESQRNLSEARYDCALETLRLQRAIGAL